MPPSMRPTDRLSTPAITVSNEAIVSDSPQSDEELQPFAASVQQALAELSAMLSPPPC